MKKKMALGIGALSFLVAVHSVSEDRDTVPLKKKTAPTPGGETLESQLLSPNKGPNGGQAKADPPTKDGTPQVGKPAVPYIASLETFGSARISESALKSFLGKDLEVWFEKGLKRDPSSPQLEAKLKERIKKKWGFPFAEWSIVQYFEPGNPAIHITLDVVDGQDVAKRMPFKPLPTGQFEDPDFLIRSWLEYETTALELIEKGQLDPQPTECPALHCPFGHKHADLKKFEKIFVEGVRKHEAALVNIQQNDARTEFRGSATYLLAYLKDGKKVVTYMVDRIRDAEDLVRNNALRVLGDIAERHPEYPVPLKPILEALCFPRVSDRSKAVYVAFHLASSSRQARDEIMVSGVPDLLKLLESKQPDHREFAHGVLRKISGRDFAATDLRAWKAWQNKLQTDRGVAQRNK